MTCTSVHACPPHCGQHCQAARAAAPVAAALTCVRKALPFLIQLRTHRFTAIPDVMGTWHPSHSILIGRVAAGVQSELFCSDFARTHAHATYQRLALDSEEPMGAGAGDDRCHEDGLRFSL